LRIGVWCDYGVTLTPTEGIGVFIWNLIGGLLELDEPVQVVMLVAPGDQHLVENLQKRFPSRLHVTPPARSSSLQFWIRLLARLRRKAHGLNRRIAFRRATLVSQDAPQPLAKIQLGILGCLEFMKVVWQKMLAGCFVVFNLLPGFHSIRARWATTFDPLVVCRNAGCDVWLIPSNRFRYPLTFPSILVIHDLVHVHYPEAVPDDIRWELERLVPARAREATLCACMSRFIRDTDLRGNLRLPLEKIRLISPAQPQDFPEIKQPDNSASKLAKLTQPYLFYPAAFRSYKNHVALIEALHLVNQSCGENSLDLVLTGIHRSPRSLSRKIAELGLESRVHILGCVDRHTLAAIYQEALATIVPSLYEQGSFPTYEALHWGCPVACSNIPSLLEQCEPLGDAMVYFNPHDPRAIAEAIFQLRDNREVILHRQQSARPSLWKRTWRDAAAEWLAALREASHIAGRQQVIELRQSA
jgi:glycosyltransferase involved in cell wall biosynthesis